MHEFDEQIISSGTAGLCPAGPLRRRRAPGAVVTAAAAAIARTRSRPVACRGRTRARCAHALSPAVPRAEPAGTLRRRRRHRVASAAAAAAAAERTRSRPGLAGPLRHRLAPASSPAAPASLPAVRRRRRRRRSAHPDPPAARPGLFTIAVGAGLWICRGLCPSRRCFQVRNYFVKCMKHLNCANIQNMRKHRNTAQTMHKPAQTLRKHFFLRICALTGLQGFTCANIAQTLRKRCTNLRKPCANDVCAILGRGQFAPDPK